jgi:hypothetical protein
MQRRFRAPHIFLFVLFAICAAWVRSYYNADLVAFVTPSGRIQAAASLNGSLVLVGTSIVVNSCDSLPLLRESMPPVDAMHQAGKFISFDYISRAFGGFAFVSGSPPITGEPTGQWIAVRIPYWFPVALCVVKGTRSAWRDWVRNERRRRGLCIHCGYDLRASGSACPECGID